MTRVGKLFQASRKMKAARGNSMKGGIDGFVANTPIPLFEVLTCYNRDLTAGYHVLRHELTSKHAQSKKRGIIAVQIIKAPLNLPNQ